MDLENSAMSRGTGERRRRTGIPGSRVARRRPQRVRHMVSLARVRAFAVAGNKYHNLKPGDEALGSR